MAQVDGLVLDAILRPVIPGAHQRVLQNRQMIRIFADKRRFFGRS
jgi:hypothetical protein